MNPHSYSSDKLIELVHDMRDILGHNMQFDEFTSIGMVSPDNVIEQFGSWENLRRAAGLPTSGRTSQGRSEEELLEELHAVIRDLGRFPTQHEFDRAANCSYDRIYRRFGRQKDVKQALAEYLRQQRVVEEHPASET